MWIIKAALPVGLGILSLILLPGCTKTDQAAALDPAAVVNGEVIAARNVEAEMEELGGVSAEQAQEIANRVLANAIDLELLAQQASQAKLDGQADVQMKLAAARRQILAEAQITALAKGLGPVGETETKAYFDAHPELFSKRRIYRLQELVATTTAENVEAVQALTKQARSPRELAAALQAKGIPVGVREAVKGAEDLPADLLARLNELSVGQSIASLQGNKMTLLILVGLEERPLDYEEAKPMIERFLANSAKRDKIETELKKYREQAKIEYRAPYADIKPAEPNQAKE